LFDQHGIKTISQISENGEPQIPEQIAAEAPVGALAELRRHFDVLPEE
jgi:hypothetical protein